MCRFTAPAVTAVGRTKFPLVYLDEWCGEYDAKPSSPIPAPFSVPSPKDPECPLEKFNLSAGLHRCLERAGICTFKQLVAKTKAELWELQGMGFTRLQEVEEFLAMFGIDLRPS